MRQAAKQLPVAGGAISQSGELRSRRLESLRAVAALGVVLGHLYGQARSAQVTAGAIPQAPPHGGFGVFALTGGVFLFFALSGYLLYWPFARRDFGSGGRIDLRRYARNRALRILPLYYLVLVVVLLVQERGGSFGQWWRFVLFLENYDQSTVASVDGPMWSLAVEVVFYITLPLLALGLAWAARGSRARAAGYLLAVAGATYILRVAKVDFMSAPRNQFWEFSPLTTFGYFVPGMLVALLRTAWQERPPRWTWRRPGSADTWLFMGVLFWVVYSSDPEREGFSAVAAFFVIGSCVLPLREGRALRALDWRPLALLGVASYSLYLWHDPVISAVVGTGGAPTGLLGLLVLLVPLCIAAAFVSYFVIERPFLRFRRRWGPTTASPARSGDGPGAPAEHVGQPASADMTSSAQTASR